MTATADLPSPESADSVKPRTRGLRRGAYLLPSLFTMGNIMLGFYAVVLGYRGEFERASWMIVFAGVLDGLDGRVARMTHTESEFGKEFDSLADVLTFGAAPAWLAFLWGLQDLGRIGWLIPLFFLLATSVRLARFNVQTKSIDSKAFVGLPSPAAAAVITTLLWAVHPVESLPDLPGGSYEVAQAVLALALVISGALMVSTFRYPSLKRIDLRQRWSYRSAAAMAAILLLLAVRPQLFFQLLALVFALYGPVGWVISRLLHRRAAAA